MEEHEFTVRELWTGGDGKGLYGVLYAPVDVDRPRLAVWEHELGCTHSTAKPYAEHLAKRGYAVYAFDFRGGGAHSRSDGDTADMTVLSEVRDLAEVMDAASGWSFVDSGQVLLIGASQGAAVAALYAGKHPERVEAALLLYPGFGIPEAMRYDFPGRKIPERCAYRGWITLGRHYVEEMYDLDLMGGVTRYKGPVLLIHGGSDDVVPVKFAERAAGLYADVEFHILPGAGHMFKGEYTDEALRLIDSFLEKRGL